MITNTGFEGCTTMEDINEAANKRFNLIGVILAEMLDDNENDTDRIVDMYREADDSQRGLMDALLVCICGETFSSLVCIADKGGEYLDD